MKQLRRHDVIECLLVRLSTVLPNLILALLEIVDCSGISDNKPSSYFPPAFCHSPYTSPDMERGIDTQEREGENVYMKAGYICKQQGSVVIHAVCMLCSRWRRNLEMMQAAADAGRGAAAMLECSTLRTCRMPCSTASCKQTTTLNLLQR